MHEGFFLKLSVIKFTFPEDPAQSLASDFGFEDNFNHTLKVEEKKNHQNRIVASREPPPVPPLPPRKASYTPTNPLPPPPVPKDRAVSLQAKDNSKPEYVNPSSQVVIFTGNVWELLTEQIGVAFCIPVVLDQDLIVWTGRHLGARVLPQTPWGRPCSPARRDKENTSSNTAWVRRRTSMWTCRTSSKFLSVL